MNYKEVDSNASQRMDLIVDKNNQEKKKSFLFPHYFICFQLKVSAQIKVFISSSQCPDYCFISHLKRSELNLWLPISKILSGSGSSYFKFIKNIPQVCPPFWDFI